MCKTLRCYLAHSKHFQCLCVCIYLCVGGDLKDEEECQVEKEKSQVKIIAGLKAHINLTNPRHKK